MSRDCDVIIVGGGVIGCSIAYYLASLGARNVLLLEKNELGAGGTSKSCAIIRTHYSIEANLHHAVESLRVFADFDSMVGGECGWHKTGYLIVGPKAHRQPMEDVFRRQNGYGIDTATLSAGEASELHPLLQFKDVGVIGYDSMAGYADPHLTVTSFARRAKEMGVEVKIGVEVTGLRWEDGVTTVVTSGDTFQSPKVILAAGPWTNEISQSAGISFPYVVSRHKVVTLQTDVPYRIDWPVVKDLCSPDKIYFRPETGGMVLLGTGDHGDPIDDPGSGFAESVDLEHVNRMDSLISNRMPEFSDARFVAGWTGPYDITPDWNPLVGHVPGKVGLYVAVGFSGHGFKLAPTIGENLAREILGLRQRVTIEPYALERFDRGRALFGAYGIGSIS